MKRLSQVVQPATPQFTPRQVQLAANQPPPPMATPGSARLNLELQVLERLHDDDQQPSVYNLLMPQPQPPP